MRICKGKAKEEEPRVAAAIETAAVTAVDMMICEV